VGNETGRAPEQVTVFGRDIQADELRYHTRRVRVSKEFTFDAAHHLHAYDGPCQHLHGHTYRLVVTACGKPDARGIVIDFSELKQIVRECIIARLDHAYLNRVLPPMNTTAENMIVWMYEQLSMAFAARAGDVVIDRLQLWETPTSWVELERREMEL